MSEQIEKLTKIAHLIIELSEKKRNIDNAVAEYEAVYNQLDTLQKEIYNSATDQERKEIDERVSRFAPKPELLNG